LFRYNSGMPHIDTHKPGSFSWLELGTTDQNAAKEFYGSLFGWQFQDHPMGPNSVYTIFKLDGKDVGACYSVTAFAPGVPPNWGVFMTVDDAGRAAARAAELGGTVLRPAFDVMDAGRMAVIQDPTGAVFSVWQPKNHPGTGITGVDGTLCWADLDTRDREAKPFYEGLFGWRLTPGQGKDPSDYWHIQNGEEFIGGVRGPDQHNQQVPPHWLLYFRVSDCDVSTGKAKELGGSVYMPPMNIEGAGRFSVITDPQGAVWALFQGL
jgi:predicted enzyme related to lactoylglutathione lyase